MKKNILIIALIISVAPSIALASWWNPFSWFTNWTFFNKNEVKTGQEVVIPTTNTDNSELDKNVAKKVETVSQSTKETLAKKSTTVPINKTSSKTVVNIESQSEIDTLKNQIKKLEDKVGNLETKNESVQEYIDSNTKLKPEISLNKTIINNDGSDRVKIQIKTINSDEKIVPNKEIEIITYISGKEYDKKIEKIETDENGNATYYTPTTTAYNRCGVSMEITIKIDGEFIFGQSVGIKDTQSIPSNTGGGACA